MQPKDPVPVAFPRRDMGFMPAYPKLRRLRGGHARNANLVTPRSSKIASSRDLLSSEAETLSGIHLKPVAGTAFGIQQQAQSAEAFAPNLKRPENARSSLKPAGQPPKKQHAVLADPELHIAATEVQRIIRGKQSRKSLLGDGQPPLMKRGAPSFFISLTGNSKKALSSLRATMESTYARAIQCLVNDRIPPAEALGRCLQRCAPESVNNSLKHSADGSETLMDPPSPLRSSPQSFRANQQQGGSRPADDATRTPIRPTPQSKSVKKMNPQRTSFGSPLASEPHGTVAPALAVASPAASSASPPSNTISLCRGASASEVSKSGKASVQNGGAVEEFRVAEFTQQVVDKGIARLNDPLEA
ncbi:hypothetical protein AB1Y20_020101 [Prymnesium parvum]|uniref:Uncharacterized protein n=1 Tax=Prymnesium parvum TaxID=97485 RepID=A0AB34JXT2_PRYPA